MSLGSRINDIRKERGMSIDELCALSGVPKGTVSKITAGITTSPTLDTVKAIAKALNCRLDDFDDVATEEKEKIAPFLSDEAIQIAKDYSLLDSYGKRAVQVILKDQQKRMMEEEAAAPHRGNVIPLPKSIQKTSAGRGAYLGPEEMETIMVEENDLTRRASFCVPVSGDSMEPTYHDGDILLVEGREDIEPGQIGVFTVDGDGYVKKRGAGELISLNPDYAPIPLTENSWCNGLVIGVLDKAWIRE